LKNTGNVCVFYFYPIDHSKMVMDVSGDYTESNNAWNTYQMCVFCIS